MTEAQRRKYNEMAAALRTIARHYQTPDQLRKEYRSPLGPHPAEALEMAYDNIQALASRAVKGVREIHYTPPPRP